jgi:hypothetical protein
MSKTYVGSLVAWSSQGPELVVVEDPQSIQVLDEDQSFLVATKDGKVYNFYDLAEIDWDNKKVVPRETNGQ